MEFFYSSFVAFGFSIRRCCSDMLTASPPIGAVRLFSLFLILSFSIIFISFEFYNVLTSPIVVFVWTARTLHAIILSVSIPFLKKLFICRLDMDIGFCYTGFYRKELIILDVYARIRYLRKNCLKMSQEKFGEVLGVNRSVIKNIELNVLARPEQKEPLYKLICKEFNVNYEWLTTGQGNMYTETKQGFVEELSDKYGLSFYAQKIIECYLELDEEQQDYIDKFLKMFVEACADGTSEGQAIDNIASKLRLVDTKNATNELTEAEALERERIAFLDMAERQFFEEKRLASKISSAKESAAG